VDYIVSGSGLTTTLYADVPTGSTAEHKSEKADIAGAAKWTFDTVNDNDQDTDASNNRAADLSIHTEWLDKGTRMMCLHGLSTPIIARVGGRAQTTAQKENIVLYVSETYTGDIAAGEETQGIMSLIQSAGDIAAGANHFGVFGEVQYNICWYH
jgi:hypothetical protein